jgi:hypothetical protein
MTPIWTGTPLALEETKACDGVLSSPEPRILILGDPTICSSPSSLRGGVQQARPDAVGSQAANLPALSS